jgi:hypothetical protein
MCEEILSKLAHRIETNIIYELVKGCIISTGLKVFG